MRTDENLSVVLVITLVLFSTESENKLFEKCFQVYFVIKFPEYLNSLGQFFYMAVGILTKQAIISAYLFVASPSDLLLPAFLRTYTRLESLYHFTLCSWPHWFTSTRQGNATVVPMCALISVSVATETKEAFQ